MKTVPVISIYVRNLEAARRFYCETLGFSENERYGDTILTLANEGSMIVLEEIGDGSSPRIVPSVLVEDIDAEFRSLKAKGVQTRQEAPVPFPAGRTFTIVDPSGNHVEIIQFDG